MKLVIYGIKFPVHRSVKILNLWLGSFFPESWPRRRAHSIIIEHYRLTVTSPSGAMSYYPWAATGSLPAPSVIQLGLLITWRQPEAEGIGTRIWQFRPQSLETALLNLHKGIRTAINPYHRFTIAIVTLTPYHPTLEHGSSQARLLVSYISPFSPILLLWHTNFSFSHSSEDLNDGSPGHLRPYWAPWRLVGGIFSRTRQDSDCIV
jgi:hypothetical protein